MTQTSGTRGQLILIPAPLAQDMLQDLPANVLRALAELNYFIVENARTARRLIKSAHPGREIDKLIIKELDKRGNDNVRELLSPVDSGNNIGLLSEAGCPGIADPGSAVVRYAHRTHIRVVPMAGPSSIVLALMASGMNGQQFQFHGYLSPKKDRLAHDLRQLEKLSAGNSTQLFIETPYRNKQVVETALHVLSDSTLFCIAVDLTAETEWIRTCPIRDWKKASIPDLHKRPAVFCLLAAPD